MGKRMSALCGLGLVSAGACAQSSVTLYGIADIYTEFLTHQAAPGDKSSVSQVRMASGGKSGSRWGLKGVEDLGGGWQAAFRLESGFNLNNGSATGGGGFDRSAWVALQHERWGALRLGRQYSTLFDIMERYSPTGAYSTLYEPAGAVVGVNFRENNVAKYIAKVGALTLETHYAFGGTPGAFQSNAAYGAGFDYAGGAFSFAAAFDDVHTPQPGGFAHFRRYAASTIVRLDRAQLMAGVVHGQSGVNTPSVVTRYTFWWAGMRYSISDFLQAIGAFYYEDIHAQNPANAQAGKPQPANPQQVTLQLNYFVSKATTLYLAGGYVRRAALDFDNYNYNFLHYTLAAGRASSVGVALGMRKAF
ncbi:porin [Burkholderia stagnalis]|uniref:Porin n=1 Tax=Burkholderia stagnalis TaxID=1503054 RepID=A0A107A0P1_9BURK|nr:porin [Burkholderia stagnalis]KVZ10936.1 porin [Burkholderia stagnalis]KWA57541.1 porin [Burkholderia stagnalis]KWA58063.1 porin [Burkholderia stagnalis]KWA67893.1 porin [Burkholderia stagnalis]KWC92946.1 porin [Burkholderia stagnalis]